MLAVHMPAPKQRRRGFVLPREYLLALRILTGWTQERAAGIAEVTTSTWRDWEHGRARIQGAAWRLLVRQAGLPATWRPTSALCAYSSTLVGSRCDVVQVARELAARAPPRRVEPIAAWRANCEFAQNRKSEREDSPCVGDPAPM